MQAVFASRKRRALPYESASCSRFDSYIQTSCKSLRMSWTGVFIMKKQPCVASKNPKHGALRRGYKRNRVLNRRGGQAMVEMALVLPILLLVLVGIMEFGYKVYFTNMAMNASREGARLAALGKGAEQVRTRVRGAIPSVQMSLPDSNIQLEILSTSNAWGAWPTDSGTVNTIPVGTQIRVTVAATYNPLTGLLSPWVSPSVRYSTVMRREL
jgi:Flp pilus assembly protein TadG